MFTSLIVDHNVTRAGLIGKGIRSLRFDAKMNYTLSPVQALFYIAGILSDQKKAIPDIIVVSEPQQQARALDSIKSIAESVAEHYASIIVLADTEDKRDGAEYYKNGASTFLAKSSGQPDFVDAVADTVCFTGMIMGLVPKQERFVPAEQFQSPSISDVLQVYM